MSAEKEATPLPEVITLTEMETLRSENIGLRMQNAQREVVELQREQVALKDAVEKRLGITNLEYYILDRNTGEGRLARKT